LRTEILSQERNVVAVKAEYEAEEVTKAVSETVRELSRKVNIKGFRRGRVPRKTLELYVGRDKIYTQTAERISQEALDDIVSEYDLDLVTTPQLNIGDLSEGNPLSIEFTFEIRPEVILPDIETLVADKIVYTVEDAEVEEGFRQILESNARLIPLDEDRAVSSEDIVETQYTSFSVKNDGSVVEIEKDKKNTMNIASVRGDIAEAIAGRRLAEEFSFDIKLEDDYPDPKLAGTVVRYNMEILQLMKREIPEGTDEKVSELSKGQYNTVGELKAELRRQMEENAKERSDASLRESAIKALAAAAEVDIPETMIDRQYVAMRKDHDLRLKKDLGESLEEYLTKNSLSVDEYESGLKKRAAEIIRNTLVLDALAEKEEISFTADDINKEIMTMAASMRVNPQDLADALSKNKEEFSSMAMKVRTRNTMNFLASKVQVTEKDAKTPEGTSEDHGPAPVCEPEEEHGTE
jgi:trigger factor